MISFVLLFRVHLEATVGKALKEPGLITSSIGAFVYLKGFQLYANLLLQGSSGQSGSPGLTGLSVSLSCIKDMRYYM